MSAQIKTIARRVFEEFQSQGKKEGIPEIVASDYIGHTPLGEINGPAGARQYLNMLRSAFPDFSVTVEDQVAEGDKVVTRWRACGTHKGPFQGIAPTGKEVEFSGITIFQAANGKLVEGWNQPDVLSLLQQLGVVSELEKA